MKPLTKDEFVAKLRQHCSTVVDVNYMTAKRAFDRLDKNYYIYDVTICSDYFMLSQILHLFKDKTKKYVLEVSLAYKSDWCPQDMPVDYLIIDGNDGSVYTWYSILALKQRGLWK